MDKLLFVLQVFLVDYGLAYRFNSEGVHKEYKEDPKRKHDGTIEFTSCDAHKGVGNYPMSLNAFVEIYFQDISK